MKIKIEDDVFEIVKRLKDIDDGYFVLYDLSNDRYEVHNNKQENTYCVTCPYTVLDSRLLDLILYSNISNIDNILNEIDTNNSNLEQNNDNEIKNKSKYMLNEIYKFASNSSKTFDYNLAFKNFWR